MTICNMSIEAGARAGAHHVALALLELTASSRQMGCDPSLLEPCHAGCSLHNFVRVLRAVPSYAGEHGCGRGTANEYDVLLAVDRNRLRLATAVLDERLTYLETHEKLRAAGLLRAFRANGFGFISDLEAAIIGMPDDAIAAAVPIADRSNS